MLGAERAREAGDLFTNSFVAKGKRGERGKEKSAEVVDGPLYC